MWRLMASLHVDVALITSKPDSLAWHAAHAESYDGKATTEVMHKNRRQNRSSQLLQVVQDSLAKQRKVVGLA